jgi:hypothetical protein
VTNKGLYYKTFAALAAYLALSVYLYRPYFEHFTGMRYAVIFNSACAATGCFVLSRRWISAFAASLFAGAVYGFSPFALGFSAYHSSAGLPLAIMPWLFCPAVYWATQKNRTGWTAMASAVLSLLPFIVIVLFFVLCSQSCFGPLFALPKYLKLELDDIVGLAIPLALRPHEFTFGFYHVPLVVGLMGLCMYVAIHRIKVMIIVAVGLALAFAGPILQTPPVVWALIPALYFSVLIGLGMQGLVLAGEADSKWILLCLIVAAVLAGVAILPPFRFPETFKLSTIMYLIACVLTGSIFFTAKSGYRWHPVRWFFLCVGLGFDILVSACYIVDRIF